MNFPFKISVKHSRILLAILIILLLLCIFAYSYIFYASYSRNEFINQSLKISEQNQLSVFKISKILLYSSASAINNRSDNSLEDLNICQYTDIAIYIDNTSSISDLTTQNTVKEMWIDNIKVTPKSELGSCVLNYKNLNNFGKFENLQPASDSRIDFNIVNTNEQNESTDYETPTFYTDCSNPISLGYLNSGIVKNYSIHDNVNSVALNGKILQQSGVDLAQISYNLTFDIHIKNYDDDSFVYHSNMDVNLDTDNKDIYNGYLYQTKNNNSDNEYIFFKEVQQIKRENIDVSMFSRFLQNQLVCQLFIKCGENMEQNKVTKISFFTFLLILVIIIIVICIFMFKFYDVKKEELIMSSELQPQFNNLNTIKNIKKSNI